MKRFVVIFMVLVSFLLTGCATTFRHTIPMVDIETLSSISNIGRAPMNALISINEDETYKYVERDKDRLPMAVDVEYTFPVGQLIKKSSLPIFSQVFDKVELSTTGISPVIGKADLIIIPEIKELQCKDVGLGGGLDPIKLNLKASIKITLRDNKGFTIWEEIFGSPDMKKTISIFSSSRKLYEIGKLASEAIASALEQAAKETYKIAVHPGYAIENMRKMISADPLNPILYLKLSSLHIRNKQYDESITAAKRAIELKSDNAVAYNALGAAYSRKKQYDEAIKTLKKAIEIDPANALYRKQMGDLFIDKEDYAEATEAFKKAVELQPANIDYILSLANTYRVMGKYDDAVASVNKAIELQTFTGIGIYSSIEGGYTVVKGVMEAGPAKKADILAGDKIIKIDGKSTKGWTDEKVTQSLRGASGTQVSITIERKGAEKTIDKTVTRETIITKEAALSFGLRSLAYRYKGSLEAALTDAEKAYSLDSANGWAQLSLGASYLDRGKYDESIKLLSQIKVSLIARILEATAYAKQGKIRLAVNFYFSIMDAYPEEAISPKNVPLMNDRMVLLQAFKPIVKEHRDKARSFESNGQYKEALSELSEALKIADDTELQDIQETLFSMIRRNPLLSEVPEDARKYALRSEVMVKEGNFEQAAAELKKAIQIAPYAARLYYNAALINAELKKYPEAIRNMKIYLKAAPDAPDARAAKDEIIKWEFIMEKGK